MAKAELEAWAETYGATLETVFVPWSKSRSYVYNTPASRRNLNWRCTLMRAGNAVYSFDYSAGIAHAPIYKRQFLREMTMQIDVQNAPMLALQSGMIARALRGYEKFGMLPTRGYTPTKMLAAATALTGLTFKRGQYEKAAQACELARDTYEQILVIVRDNPGITPEGVQEKLQLAAKSN